MPARFRDWRFTQTSGGERAEIRVKAKRDGVVHFATAASQRRVETAGWTPVPDATFHDTGAGKTKMSVFRRALKAGEELDIPQGNWTGGVALLPGETGSGR